MPGNSKNEGLQVARAIAALTVAYFHSYIALRAFPETAQMPFGPLKNWGYLGVDFFFAISGFVICLVASKPTFSPIPFAIKRVFRLYPMYWVAMAVIALMIALGKYRVEPIGHFLYSMTLLPQNGPSAYDVSWTLEREMVFYAIVTCTVPFIGIWGLSAVRRVGTSAIRGAIISFRRRRLIFWPGSWCSSHATRLNASGPSSRSRPELPCSLTLDRTISFSRSRYQWASPWPGW
jgi:peptidoglycan/LPS O-acetylase OafA/YrhL